MITIKNEAGLEARQGHNVETICKTWWGDDIDIWLNVDEKSGEALRNGEVIAEFTVYYNVGNTHKPITTGPAKPKKPGA